MYASFLALMHEWIKIHFSPAPCKDVIGALESDWIVHCSLRILSLKHTCTLEPLGRRSMKSQEHWCYSIQSYPVHFNYWICVLESLQSFGESRQLKTFAKSAVVCSPGLCWEPCPRHRLVTTSIPGGSCLYWCSWSCYLGSKLDTWTQWCAPQVFITWWMRDACKACQMKSFGVALLDIFLVLLFGQSNVFGGVICIYLL